MDGCVKERERSGERKPCEQEIGAEVAENNSSKLTHYLIASSSSCVGNNGGEASDDECVLVSMMVDGLSMSSISFFL